MRCESWTIKKAEHQRINAFKLWCWGRLLRVPWTAQRSNQSILKKSNLNTHWKDWWWSWSSNTLATWCDEPAHWKRLSLEETLMLGKTEGTWRRGQQRMRRLHCWLNGHEFEQTPWDSGGQGSLMCCSPWGHRVWHDWNTEQQQPGILRMCGILSWYRHKFEVVVYSLL